MGGGGGRVRIKTRFASPYQIKDGDAPQFFAAYSEVELGEAYSCGRAGLSTVVLLMVWSGKFRLDANAIPGHIVGTQLFFKDRH